MNRKDKIRVYSLALIVLSLFFINSCKKSDSASIDILLPAIVSDSVTAVTLDSAICWGTVTADGGAVLSHRGFCYSVNAAPTIADSTASGGTSLGHFSVYLTRLIAGTTYHARAYASNSAGVVYGTEFTFTTQPLALGANYHGGKIAFIDGTNLHGLIAANADSTGKTWNNALDTVTTATATNIGAGSGNTALIITTQGIGVYAASICDKFVSNGFDDWCLPSKDELDQLYINSGLIGGFDPLASYWSSSETSVGNASSQFFGNGSQTSAPKLTLYNVRPVRSF